MAEVIKTKYMDKATRGYSEYVARDLNALQTISPKEGDRAILLDGSLYICVDNGQWDIAGGDKETDILIITAGYKTGGERGYTIDKTYAEIYSAAEAGKAIAMIDSAVITAAGLPVILYPYSYNSDGSGTFVTIAKGDDMGGSKDYRYSITVYPDNTVIPRWEDLSQQLDHTVTFKANGEPYTVVSVKDGQSVSAPNPNPTSESGSFTGWLNGETSVTFPYTPTGNVELIANFSTVRSEIEVYDAGTVIYTDSYGNDKTKLYDGTAIVGLCSYNNRMVCIAINPNNAETCQITGNTGASTYTYNGVDYYYIEANGVNSLKVNGYEFSTPAGTPTIVKKTLDYYYMVE